MLGASWGGGLRSAQSGKVCNPEILSMVAVWTPGSTVHINELKELRPEYCWQYSAQRMLAHVWTRCYTAELANRHFFHATVVTAISPLDFSVWPNSFTKALTTLESKLSAAYKDDFDTHTFAYDEMFEGVPCAILDASGQQAKRGKVIRIEGAAVLVSMVDYSATRFVPRDLVRPLLSEFGRVMPMSLNCSIHGVEINDMSAVRLEEWYDLLVQCTDALRLQVVRVVENKFVVRAWHPLEERDIGTAFCRKSVHPETEFSKKRRYKEHLLRMRANNRGERFPGEWSEDEEDDDDDDDDDSM